MMLKGSTSWCRLEAERECRGGPFSGITASSGPLIAVIQLEQDKGSEFPFYLLKALLDSSPLLSSASLPFIRSLGRGRGRGCSFKEEHSLLKKDPFLTKCRPSITVVDKSVTVRSGGALSLRFRLSYCRHFLDEAGDILSSSQEMIPTVGDE